MTDLKFKEYWWVYLESNPNWDRDKVEHKQLMKGHFEFIDNQIAQGNLFVAIPMSPSGGQYYFDGQLLEDAMRSIISSEPSIGKVFTYQLKRAFIPEHHVYFVLESKKRIEEFHKIRREEQSKQH
ncbi:MAG: hypothetical protein INQ03_16875 [Candidatus Heimdallarchaeota archaeon]|nr:hypothetical protein [Candidatus Heimdallarchaeota archaeon]